MKLTKISGISVCLLTAVSRQMLYCSFVVMAIFPGCSSSGPSGNSTTVTIKEIQWLIDGKPVLKDSPAEGLLVNVRMVNAVFEDSGPLAKTHLPDDFSPDENTTRFIAQMPDYY